MDVAIREVIVDVGFRAALAVRPERHQLDARPVAEHARAAWTRRLLPLGAAEQPRTSVGTESSERGRQGGEPHGGE
jgi:hypothetical protein